MPRFRDDALTAFALVDEVFAEDFVVTPYAEAADKRAAPAPDTTRAVVTLPGVWRARPIDPKEPNAYDQREYRRPGVAGDLPTVEFSPAALAAFPGIEIRSGDQILRVETGQSFLAQTPVPSANGLLRVRVNAL